MIAVLVAHVGGIPLEEGLLALVPAAGALSVVLAAPLRRIGRFLRRSQARVVLNAPQPRDPLNRSNSISFQDSFAKPSSL
jgi:hypothetical protein